MVEFQVVSSSTGEVYDIAVSRDGDDLRCTCTCAAGQNGMHCKHRLAILSGDGSVLRAGDRGRLDVIPAMLAGTDVEAALVRLGELERQKDEIDRQLKAAKKALARSLAS